MLKKLTALLTVFAISINSFAFISYAYDYSGAGEGTQENPYIIENVEQLKGMNRIPHAYYKLGQDIDLENKIWNPIGSIGLPFTGGFDGDGYVIRNLTLKNDVYSGFIGYGSNADLKNITIENANIEGAQYQGALAGYLTGSTVENCKVTGTVTMKGGAHSGGLIGYIMQTEVRNSSVEGELSITQETTGSVVYAGGLTGYMSQGSIDGCAVEGQAFITGQTAGGLVGHTIHAPITNSSVRANGLIKGTQYVGGLVGYTTGDLKGNSAAIDVEGKEYVGGLAGRGVVIEQSWASGNVVSDTGYAGGLAGAATQITRSYATGNVESRNYDSSYTGGLVGLTGTGNNTYMSVENSFALGDVNGARFVGAVIGGRGTTKYLNAHRFYSAGKVNGKENSAVCGESGSGIVLGGFLIQESNREQMMTKTMYGQFNFNEIWNMEEGRSYPYLREMEVPAAVYPGTVQYEGDGTGENPFQIRTVEEFKEIRLNMNASFILMNDLDFENEQMNAFTGIFTGRFNGQGYSLQNLVLNEALFRSASDAIVENLTVQNAVVTTANNNNGPVAILAGQMAGGEIRNCHVQGSIVNGRNYVGGLVGFNDGGNITASSADVGISQGSYSGGLIGYNQGEAVEITGSWSKGTVQGGNAGGLVGYDASKNLDITQSWSAADVIGSSYAGGLIGRTGYINTISESYTTGAITVTSNNFAGGLVGYSGGNITIENCYAAGSVSSRYGGGLTGYGAASDKIINSYATTDLSGTAIRYGVAQGGKATGCYFDQEKALVATPEEQARTSEQMMELATYEDWDFDNVWEMKTYPVLRNTSGDAGGNPAGAGEGTAENPYIIENVEQLKGMEQDLSAYYKLGQDIDLENKIWSPVGIAGLPFTGGLDGDGYVIRNLVLRNNAYSGFIGYGSNADLKNITIENATIESAQYQGALAGYLTGSAVENCKVTGSIAVKGGAHSGGLIGYIMQTIVRDSSVEGELSITQETTGSVVYAGGLIGLASGTMNQEMIIGCEVKGQLYIVGQTAGGLAGYSMSGKITESAVKARGLVKGTTNVGGLVGRSAWVEQSSAAINVEGESSVGGLAGNGGTIVQSWASGNVLSNAGVAGGLAGTATSITRSYATGNVESSTYNSIHTGGLIGVAGSSINATDISLEDCFALGDVIGKDKVGTVIGGRGNAKYLNAYRIYGAGKANGKDGVFCGDTGSGMVVTGYSIHDSNREQMLVKAKYPLFDFEAVWDMEEGRSYPYLREVTVPTGVYPGTVKYEGDGTGENPYQISTVEEFKGIGANLNAHFILMQDLDFEGQKVDTVAGTFTGHLNGQGYALENLRLSAGLFSAIENGVIENLMVKHANVTVAGNAQGAILTGRMTGGEIRNCHVQGSINDAKNHAGGFIGLNDGGKIIESSADVTISQGSNVGGFIGYNQGESAEITGSWSKGILKGGYVGGFIGYDMSKNNTITQSWSTADVNGGSAAGGLIGRTGYINTISESYTTGAIAVTNNNYAGGLVGHSAGNITIENCYATGSVSGRYGGGLTGYGVMSDKIINSYATTDLSGATGKYGLFQRGEATNSYFDQEKAMVTIPAEQARTSEQMGELATYEGWDFDNIWEMKTYPVLRNTGGNGGENPGGLEEGTPENPYIIEDVAQLKGIGQNLSAYYKLGQDIDLENKVWSPVGNIDLPFTGGLDGDGYVIRNVTIKDDVYSGLIGYGSNADLKNITIENAIIESNKYQGVLAGYLTGGTVENCKVTGTVKVKGGAHSGGLIGYIMQTEVRNSSMEGELSITQETTGSVVYAGGLIGYINQGSVDGCTVEGQVFITGQAAGGLVGYSVTSKPITNSSVKAKGLIKGTQYVGGLAGYAAGEITASNAAINVEGKEFVGGLTGRGSIIKQSWASGNVLSDTGVAGGLAGTATYITRSYATGNVESSTYNSIHTGGLIGVAGSSINATDISLEDCFALGDVIGKDKVGTVIGGRNNAKYLNAYRIYGAGKVNGKDGGYCGETGTGMVITGYAIYDSNWEQMLIKAKYPLFDFETVWDMEEGRSYPYLRELEVPAGVFPGTVQYEGDGTGENPYQINTVEGFKGIGANLNAHYTLMNDLDFGNEQIDAFIGSFTGHLNGQGYTLQNLKLSGGLFRIIEDGVIENLTVKNAAVTVTGNNFGAVLTAQMTGGEIRNCHIQGSISNGGSYVGGLIGYNNEGKITGSSADVVISQANNAGGLIGYNQGEAVEITGSWSNGMVKGGNAGGLVGFDSSKNLDITQSWSAADVNGSSSAGGLIGKTGYINTISESFTTGAITVSGSNYAGGLVGYSGGNITIENSYAAGSVSGRYGGGLTGYGVMSDKIINSYATTDLSGATGKYGLIQRGEATNSYFDQEKAMVTTPAEQARSSAQMGELATYEDWDFDNIWEMKTYPVLRNTGADAGENPGGSGEGTQENPYIIENIEQLKAMGQDLSAYYKLGQDIDLENKIWNPIGSIGLPFTGGFDGDGYVIRNLTLKNDTHSGFIGYGSNADLKNITIENANIEGAQYQGALAGYLTGSTVENCKATGSITLKGGAYSGGLIGYILQTKVMESSVEGELSITQETTGSVVYAGGLTGYMNQGFIDGCRVEGQVFITGQTAGGIVGYSTIYTPVTNSSVNATGLIKGTQYVGGLVGYTTGDLKGNSAAIDVQGKEYVGGLAGKGAVIEKSWASGNVRSDTGYAGGLAGTATQITHSYATGNVESNTYNSAYTGGLAGIMGAANDTYISIENCFTLGEVKGKNYVGSIIGGRGTAKYLKVYRAYAARNMVTSGETGSGIVLGWNYNIHDSNREQMLTKKMYNQFDFETIWDMEEGRSYPYLREMEAPAGVYPGTVQYEGDGTEENPYQIRTIEEFKEIRLNLNAHFILMNDLDFENGQMDAFAGAFTGHLNGQGYTLQNLKLSGSLFRIIEDGVIENLTVKNAGVTVTGNNYGAILTAQMAGGEIRNCHVQGSISNGGGYVGGLIGFNTGGKITGSSADVVISQANNAGGLIGYNQGETVEITGSWSKGTVKGGHTGGLIGFDVSKSITITQSWSAADIIGSSSAGGLIGITGNINTISESFATGAITVSGNNYAGGLVGNSGSNLTIENCYATGSVSGRYGGGLIGNGMRTDKIINSYASTDLSGATAKHGLIAWGEATTSYFDQEKALVTTPAEQARTSEQMGDTATYEDWDFDNIWEMKTYPVLRNTGEDMASPTKLTAVENILLEKITPISAVISWDAQDGADYYQIDANGKIIDVEGSRGTVTGLEPETAYELSVRAVNYNMKGAWSQPVSFTTETQDKLMPTGVVCAEAHNDSVLLVWDAIEGVDYYEVRSGEKVYQSETNEIVIGGLLPDMDYEFAARSVYKDYVSGWSETVTVSTGTIRNTAGAPEDPHLVYTAGQLVAVSQDLGAAYRLMRDINLDNEPFEPIGATGTPFTGQFDGNGFTISNLYMPMPSEDGVGLFGATAGAEIQNLYLEKVDITGNESVGALIGIMDGGIVTDCHISSVLNVVGRDGNGKIVGLEQNGVQVINCTIEDFQVGGLAAVQTFEIAEGIPLLFSLDVSNWPANAARILTLSYNPNQVQLMDMAAQAAGIQLEKGIYENAGIEILSHENGKVSFKMTAKDRYSGLVWTGILTMVKVLPLTTGETTITFEQ